MQKLLNKKFGNSLALFFLDIYLSANQKCNLSDILKSNKFYMKCPFQIIRSHLIKI